MTPTEYYDEDGNKKTLYTPKEQKEKEQKAAAAVIGTLIFLGIGALLGWLFKKVLLVFGVKKPATSHYIIIFIVCFLLVYGLITFLDFNQTSTKGKDNVKSNQVVLLQGETKPQLINRFELFKKDNILISKRQFSDILDRNSPGRVHILTDFSDSVIIVKPTKNYRHTHFIEAGSRFKMLDIAGANERIAEGRVYFSIDHEDYIKNKKYRYQSKIQVRDEGYFAFWEIDPKDIRFEVQKLGVAIMQNNLEYFSQNNFKEYFIDSTTFFSFFPSSDLITLFKKNIVSPIELLEGTIGSAEIATDRVTHEERNDLYEGDDTQLSKITTNILKNEEKRNKVYDQIDSVKKILLHPNLSRKEKRKLNNFLNKPETESIDFNLLNQIYSVRQSLQNPNLSRKEKRRLKKFIKQLENKIIFIK